MKIFSLLLIWVVFTNQISAFNYSSKDGVENLGRAIAESLNKRVEPLRKAKLEWEAAQAMKNSLTSLEDKIKKLSEELRKNTNEIKRKITNLETQISRLKQQVKKLEDILKRIDELTPALTEIIKENQSLENSQKVLFPLSQDRAKVAKLLEAIEKNNHSEIIDLLRINSVKDIEIREVGNTDGVKLVFRIGSLVHCLSTKTLCGGANSFLTKVNVRNVKNAEETIQSFNNLLNALDKESKAAEKELQNFLAVMKEVRESENLSQSGLQQRMEEFNRVISMLAQASQKLAEIRNIIISISIKS